MIAARNVVPLIVLGFLLWGCASRPRGLPGKEGIPNFGKIDGRLYRGAQPDPAGIQTLSRHGIKTIINLRKANDVWPDEEPLVRAAAMAYTNVPLSGVRRPTAEQVRRVLAIIEAAPGPVFVHCQFGCDRTGTVVACYRLQRHEWTIRQAVEEAKDYGMTGWPIGMKTFVAEFGRGLQRKRADQAQVFFAAPSPGGGSTIPSRVEELRRLTLQPLASPGQQGLLR